MTRQLPDAVSDGVREELKQWFAARPDVTAEQFAQYTGLAGTTVRHFLTGNCPGGVMVVSEIRKALLLARAGEILQPGGATEANAVVLAEERKAVRRVVRTGAVYETEAVRRVAEVLEYCAENCAIGIVTADFGVGKTEAVAHWRRQNGRKFESVAFEFDDFTCCNKLDFVWYLARQLRVASKASGLNATGRLFWDLCEHLRENPCLLIFDQCEMVRPRVFQIVRQLWDRTHDAGVGIALLAAPLLLSRMTRSGMQDLGALSSRVGIWAAISGVSRAEMAAIVKHEGIEDVDELAFDIWWRATGGSMRRLMRSIDLLKSRHSGKRVTEKTIAGVAGHLWGMVITAPVAAPER